MKTPRPLDPRPPPVPFEARASERLEPKQRILVSAVGDGELLARGMALNISEGGFCCYLYGPSLGVQQEVIARLSLFGRNEVFRVVARVAWMRPSEEAGAAHYGLQWIEGADLKGIRDSLPSLT